ncbi:MAG: mechanosensitive ion channel [Erysipelotrichaceae bacterium]|nr:mechanosensitive ion channel [Erysipelotrichaceae bacterium]
MKHFKRIIASVIILAICVGLGYATGLSLEEFVDNIHINLESVLKVAIIIAFLLAVKHILKFLINLIHTPKLATFTTILSSAVDYLALILMVIWSLRILGADINGIIAGLGILALIIGTSAEGLIEDMLTGLFLLFEGTYKVGDIIEVDDFMGTVTEIGIRTTTIVDNGGNEKIFNNSSMKDVLNRSTHKSVAVVDLSLPTETDLQLLEKADWGNIEYLGLQEIESDDIVVRFTMEAEEKDIYAARRQMNEIILAKLKELGLK